MVGSVCVGFFAFGEPSEYSTCLHMCDTASFADKRNIQMHSNSAASSVPPCMGFSCQIQLVSPIMIHFIHIILG